MNRKDKELYLKAMGQRVKERREELRLSQEELSDRLGYKSKTSINKIELGIQGIPQRKMRDFAQQLQTTIEYLMDGDDKLPETSIFAKPPAGIIPVPLTKRLPLLGTIACGQPAYASQEYSYIDGPIKADFCLRAHGDSMTGARINDGDIVFCKAQDMVEDGEIAAVIIDDAATLKRFYYYPDQGMVLLRAENPAYKDIVYVGEDINDIRILGKAIAFQSAVR